MTRKTKIKTEEKFPISGQGYVVGKLLDDTECQIWLDMGASKSQISQFYYLRCKAFHTLPKFTSKTTKNTSRKWTICGCVIHNTSSYRHTWPQI